MGDSADITQQLYANSNRFVHLLKSITENDTPSHLWQSSSAFYGRLNVIPNSELRRPSADFQRSFSTSKDCWGVPGHPESQYLRRDLLDLGSVQDRFELGKTYYNSEYLIFVFIFRC